MAKVSVRMAALVERGRGTGQTSVEAILAGCFERRLYQTSNPDELRCRCPRPDHRPDRRPSFRVSRRKQVGYCDVCQWGAGVIGLTALWLGGDGEQARRWLALLGKSLPQPRIVAAPAAPERNKSSARASGGQRPSLAEPVVHYTYRDDSGAPVARKVRFPGKRFAWQRHVPGRGWVYGLDSVEPGLYAIERLTRHPWLLVVEGEKDVETAWAHRLPATTNPEGAGPGKWRSTYSRALRRVGARRVYVVPDNDKVGHAHAREVVRSCRSAGLRAWLLQLPGLPEKGDLTDYFAGGGTRHEVLRRCRTLRRAR